VQKSRLKAPGNSQGVRKVFSEGHSAGVKKKESGRSQAKRKEKLLNVLKCNNRTRSKVRRAF